MADTGSVAMVVDFPSRSAHSLTAEFCLDNDCVSASYLLASSDHWRILCMVIMAMNLAFTAELAERRDYS